MIIVNAENIYENEIKNFNVEGVFPVPLYRTNLKDELDEDEVKSLIIDNKNDENWIENINKNFSSNNSYILDSGLDKMKNSLMNHINNFFFNVLGEDDSITKIKMTQSWLNFNPKGTSHHQHSHSNSIISGVLYLSCDDKTGNFNIHRTENKLFKNFLTEKKSYNTYTYTHMWYKPKKYDLYLFPSNLEHSVDVNESENLRISLAFNTFYTGKIGSYNQKTELKF